jgi:hypothetical protein
MNIRARQGATLPVQEEDAVGIVVQGAAHEEQRPRVVAFVWGGKVRPRPSLPFGRWKKGVRPAA